MDEESETKVIIDCYGPLRVTAPGGVSLTPSSVRGQAILAFLATAEGHVRNRAWVQDKLWSTRETKQGAGSLRQALLDIRKSLGAHKVILGSNRKSIWLEPRLIVVQDRPTSGEPRAFLEGIDIKDGEFEDWLSLMRQADEIPSEGLVQRLCTRPSRLKRSVWIDTLSEQSTSNCLIEESFVDGFRRSLEETFSIEVMTGARENLQQGVLIVTVQAFEPHVGSLGIRATIEDNDTQRNLWANSAIAEFTPGPLSKSPHHLSLSHQLILAITDILAKPLRDPLHDSDANYLAGRGLRALFSMRPDQIALSDDLFAQAYEREARGIFLAWRAQAAVISYIEQTGDSFAFLGEQADEWSRLAIEHDPLNSSVLSAVANARLVFENNVVASRELAKMALEINPANPQAWWSWSNAMLYGDAIDAAYQSATVAQRLANNSNLKFWMDFQVSLTAAVSGRYDQAISNAEMARALSPNFRPPLRYLTALYAQREDRSSALRSSEQLRRLEPSFTPDLLVGDTQYPASLIRSKKLVTRDKVQSLISG